MIHDNRGSVLVYTLIVVSLLCLIATSTLARSLDDYRADAVLADRIRAHYLAEAGATYGKARLREESLVPCPSGRVDVEIPEGLFPADVRAPEVTYERLPNGKWEIVSVGRSGMARQVVRVALE